MSVGKGGGEREGGEGGERGGGGGRGGGGEREFSMHPLTIWVITKDR